MSKSKDYALSLVDDLEVLTDKLRSAPTEKNLKTTIDHMSMLVSIHAHALKRSKAELLVSILTKELQSRDICQQ